MSAHDLIAERKLLADVDGKVIEVAVRIFRPEPVDGAYWECSYEIGLPDRLKKKVVGGIDSVQALTLAMHFIAAELYAGRASRLLNLRWLEPAGGFGFPLPSSLRDLAQGDDRLL